MMPHEIKNLDFKNGFSAEDDIFKRKRLYELIYRFIDTSQDKGLVMALDDRWGNGKTSFLKMLKSEIELKEDSKVNVIYYDSFENDFHSEPFLSITSEIYQVIDNKGTGDKLRNGLVEAGKKVGTNLLKGAAHFAVTTVTSGIISNDVLKDAISNSLSSPLESYIEERIKSAKEDKKSIENFKKTLENIYNETGKKTLIIIDELDRARPDFSLELIEKIKHLFSAKGIIFLLSVNRDQFEKSIEKRYGEIDTRTYLNKFVHYWFTLPKVSGLTREAKHGYSQPTVKRQLQQLDRNIKIINRGKGLESTLSYLIEVNGQSLREVERCYSLICAIDNIEKINDVVSDTYESLLALVAYLKVVNPQLLSNIRSKSVKREEVLNILNIYDCANDSEAFAVNRLLEFHYLTEDEYQHAAHNGKYSDIDILRSQQKRDIFDSMNEVIEYLHLG